MGSKRTQAQGILEQLKRGPITAIDALNGCGCFRLAARINDLRRSGYLIASEKRRLPNGKTVAEYSLIGKFSE
ncbi:MAG: helix-turn-helix domain-containing protein [Hydrogenophilus thermoluteolus]